MADPTELDTYRAAGVVFIGRMAIALRSKGSLGNPLKCHGMHTYKGTTLAQEGVELISKVRLV